MRALYVVLLAPVLSTLAACGETTEPRIDTSLKPTSTNVAGAFNLVSANGTAPPFAAFATPTADYTLLSDTIVVSANNTWTEATQFSVLSLIDNSTSTTFTLVSGNYAIANAQINFTMTQGSPTPITFPGSVTGDTLTIIFSGRRLLYTRNSP
jgi:hypothetical protein